MKRYGLVVLAGLLSVGFFADRAHATVDEIIDQMVDRMAALQSIHQQAEMKVSFTMGDDAEEVIQESVFIFQRPDKLVIDSEMMVLVGDGAQFSVIFPQFAHYVQMSMEQGLSSVLSELEEYIGGATLPDIAALLSDDPKATLTDFVENVQVETLEEDMRNGRKAWVVRILIEEEEIALKDGLKVWIDQETGLVSGMEADVDLSTFQDSGLGESMPSGYTLNYSVNVIGVNQPIEEDFFAYDLSGFTQAADFDALSESLQGEAGQTNEDAMTGDAAPDFTLTLLDGSEFRLADQRGKVVLVDFWATWCPPCVESLPYLQGIYAELKSDDVVFVGVSLDRPGTENRVKNMVERNGIEYLIGINEDGSIAMEYGAVSIPTLVVIDQQGIVRHTKVGFSPAAMEEVKQAIKELTGR